MPRRWRITASIAASGCILLAVCRLAAAEVASNGKHCLCRVTNARAPFYLLGSVHTLQSSDYFRTPVIEEAIKQSQQICSRSILKMSPLEKT
jgi:TraB/PrgY/gumN family